MVWKRGELLVVKYAMLRLGKTNTTKPKTNGKKKKKEHQQGKKTFFFFFSWRRQRKREGGRERERRNSAKCSCTSGFRRPLQYRQGVTQLLNISWEMWSKDCPHPCSSLFQPCGHWCAKWPAPPCVPLSPQLTQLPDVSVLVIPPPKAKQVPLPLCWKRWCFVTTQWILVPVSPQLGPTLRWEAGVSSCVPLPVSPWWPCHETTTRLLCTPLGGELTSKYTFLVDLPTLYPLPFRPPLGSTAPFSAAKGFQVLGNKQQNKQKSTKARRRGKKKGGRALGKVVLAYNTGFCTGISNLRREETALMVICGLGG